MRWPSSACGDDGVGGGLLEDGINHTICFIQLDV